MQVLATMLQTEVVKMVRLVHVLMHECMDQRHQTLYTHGRDPLTTGSSMMVGPALSTNLCTGCSQ